MDTLSIIGVIANLMMIIFLIVICIRVQQGAKDAEKQCEKAEQRLQEEKQKLANLRKEGD